MRNASLFMRSIAAVVLVTFTALIISPAVMAIENAPAAPTSTPQSDEAKLSKAIQNTQRTLEQMADKLNTNQEITPELTDLQTLKAEITTLNNSVITNFDAIKANLQSHNLPQTILDRHNAAVADYQAQTNTLLQNLTDIETTPTPNSANSRSTPPRPTCKANNNSAATNPATPTTSATRVTNPTQQQSQRDPRPVHPGRSV